MYLMPKLSSHMKAKQNLLRFPAAFTYCQALNKRCCNTSPETHSPQVGALTQLVKVGSIQLQGSSWSLTPQARCVSHGSSLTPYPACVAQAYSNNLVDHHIILDLLPWLAQAYFSGHIPANLSYLQAAILLSLGLQQNDVSSLHAAIQLPANQALALFNKVCPRPPQPRVLQRSCLPCVTAQK